MSAHLRPLVLACSREGCVRRATVEAFNTYNASLGKYCRQHGEERIKPLLAPDPREGSEGR